MVLPLFKVQMVSLGLGEASMHKEVVNGGDDNETREDEVHHVESRCTNDGAKAERR